MTMVIFDLNHVGYRCLFAAKKDILDVGWKYFKNIMYNTIFSTCKRFNATEVFLAVDSKENWRKKIFSEYKQTRKEKREEQDDINWDEFFQAFSEFVEDTKRLFPFYVIQVKYLEADDIVGVLAKEWQHKNKIVVTSDGDYNQLLKYNNIQIYDPIRSRFIKSDDPVKDLKAKIIMGDRGDNIPAIKPKIGEKTAEKLVENPELLQEIFNDKTPSYTKEDGTVITIGDECKEKFKLNTFLIDLSKTPDTLVKTVKKTINEYNLPNGKDIFMYFTENKYRDIMRRMEDIDTLCKTLNENKKPNTFELLEEIV